jgi:flagellar motility protein MotE (MotC chaperone)
MIRTLRDVRLLPVVLLATVALFALKAIGLIIDGRYALDDAVRAADEADVTGTIPGAATGAAGAGRGAERPAARRSWAQQMFNYPDVTGAVGDGKPEVTGQTPAPKKDANPEEPKDPKEPKGKSGWTPVPLEGRRPPSAAEVAILERLQERRSQLEARSKEIEMRENLLKAAEKRLEGRVAELKELEARINDSVGQRDEGEAARFKNVVTMYENMKAKDAAKIFDRLDLKVLVEVATKINPRRMSDILAQMTPEAAERLTVELAAHSAAKAKPQPQELPKIEGKPAP